MGIICIEGLVRVSAVSIASSLLMWVSFRVETMRCAECCSGVLLVNSERCLVPCGAIPEFHLPNGSPLLSSALGRAWSVLHVPLTCSSVIAL